MKEIILIKNGELVLKGLNRRTFEDQLVKCIRHRLKNLGEIEIMRQQSTIQLIPKSDDYDVEEALDRISRIFGIAAYCRACVAEKTVEDILQKAPAYLEQDLKNAKTFKVEARRSDKRFPLKSPEICVETGGAILDAFPHLSVDVHNPDVTVQVEVRDSFAYIHAGQREGAGGMPASSAGRAAILISGGIDSPVAAWTMAKRGLWLYGIHFASPPYTGPKAEQKVKQLLQKVARYSGPMDLDIVSFTEIQEQIAEHCPEDFFTLIMRRMMMRISTELARRNNCAALITGESLGQVASQTLPALTVTDNVSGIPVLRPLIGMDKKDIIKISRDIDTFDISVLPYEDCCTVFTPKHPKTRPTIEQCEAAEKALNVDELVMRACDNVRRVFID